MSGGAFTRSSALPEVAWPRAQDAVFFLARGGLRRLSRSKDEFLGHAPTDLFWRDMLEMVHGEDRPAVEAALGRVKREPGRRELFEARLRDASGGWRFVELTVQNMPEAPGDCGLVAAGAREVTDDAGSRREPW